MRNNTRQSVPNFVELGKMQKSPHCELLHHGACCNDLEQIAHQSFRISYASESLIAMNACISGFKLIHLLFTATLVRFLHLRVILPCNVTELFDLSADSHDVSV
eukprot:TRINITY_DN21443_c0_g1_i1.p2 TRINITY_DN21443_c0_g1~~TRINITY_DN21443_c0_g1_i1.p2  ORF type:complete len:104 (-),score=2.57 TRINITY_DN21443_c0_g1_i1:816-1127(-)